MHPRENALSGSHSEEYQWIRTIEHATCRSTPVNTNPTRCAGLSSVETTTTKLVVVLAGEVPRMLGAVEDGLRHIGNILRRVLVSTLERLVGSANDALQSRTEGAE